MFYLRRTSDEAVVRELHERLFPGIPFDECPAYWLVWKDGTEYPVGFCAVRRAHSNRAWAFLARAALLREARGHGIQRRMIEARERWARSEGMEGTLTYVSNRNEASLVNLLRQGYHIYDPDFLVNGKRRRGKRDGFIYLAKRLDGRKHRHRGPAAS